MQEQVLAFSHQIALERERFAAERAGLLERVQKAEEGRRADVARMREALNRVVEQQKVAFAEELAAKQAEFDAKIKVLQLENIQLVNERLQERLKAQDLGADVSRLRTRLLRQADLIRAKKEERDAALRRIAKERRRRKRDLEAREFAYRQEKRSLERRFRRQHEEDLQTMKFLNRQLSEQKGLTELERRTIESVQKDIERLERENREQKDLVAKLQRQQINADVLQEKLREANDLLWKMRQRFDKARRETVEEFESRIQIEKKLRETERDLADKKMRIDGFVSRVNEQLKQIQPQLGQEGDLRGVGDQVADLSLQFMRQQRGLQDLMKQFKMLSSLIQEAGQEGGQAEDPLSILIENLKRIIREASPAESQPPRRGGRRHRRRRRGRRHRRDKDSSIRRIAPKPPKDEPN